MAFEPKINDAKKAAVEHLKGEFGKGTDFIFADYRGLTVEQITKLRDKLREVGAEFHVVKNNYARIAFEQLGKNGVSSFFEGPTGVAISTKDAAPVAKAFFELPKEWTFSVKGGLIGPTVFNAKQTEAFSKLPGRNELLASLMGTMKAPTQNLVYAMNGVASKLVRTLQAVADQKAGK